MIRLPRFSRILVASTVALSLGAPSALAQGGCGADGRILDRADLLARLGANAVLEDFETFDIRVGNAVTLNVFCLDDTTVANGQGPGLVQPGALYCDPASSQLQWNGDQYFERTTKTILSNHAGAIHITYMPSVTAMGVDLSAYVGYGYTGTATIYDVTNGVLGTVDFTLVSGGAERSFVGWADTAGIQRVEIYSPTWPWSPKIDDHAYGRCPATQFCFGDGSTVACPCGNNGISGHGCENSANTGGAVLLATGNYAVASDTAVLTSSGELASALTIFFSGPAEIPHRIFGDGLRCAGGHLRRLYVKNAVNGVAAAPVAGDPPITARMAVLGSPIHEGETHYYQAYYRDPMEGFCPERRFNISSGIRILWIQ